MDYGSLSIVAAIVLYGTFEYHRREQRHREAMSYLRRGEQPPARPGNHLLVSLMTTGAVGVLLLVSGSMLIIHGVRIPRYGASIVPIGLIFALLAIPVIVMFVRDLRLYRSRRRGEGRVR